MMFWLGVLIGVIISGIILVIIVAIFMIRIPGVPIGKNADKRAGYKE